MMSAALIKKIVNRYQKHWCVLKNEKGFIPKVMKEMLHVKGAYFLEIKYIQPLLDYALNELH